MDCEKMIWGFIAFTLLPQILCIECQSDEEIQRHIKSFDSGGNNQYFEKNMLVNQMSFLHLKCSLSLVSWKKCRGQLTLKWTSCKRKLIIQTSKYSE